MTTETMLPSDFRAVKDFNTLKKNLKKDFSGLKQVKIAIVGDSATQFLNQALRGYGFEVGVDFNVYEADYDQIERQVFDSSSELYAFEPEYVLIFQGLPKLTKKFYKSTRQEKETFADQHISFVDSLYSTLTQQLKTKVIYLNIPEAADAVFGNFSSKTPVSLPYQVRKINYELMRLSQERKNLFICDFASICAYHGKATSFDAKIYVSTDIILGLDILPWLVKNISDIILSISGKFKKCLILDLDNTTWGGIIGDDGIENIQVGDLGIGKAFSELQLWAKQLKERGIILAVCSKNDEHIAREPFEKHPEMVLRMDDIAVFVANWNNKADNIRYIQSVLNIGFDSMVFIDDNPFERNMVRTNVPEVTVPELPEDPALYLDFLQQLNLFETASFSEEDEHRTKQYQEEAKRVVLQKGFANEEEFLSNLQMQSEVKPFDKFNIPRVAQLTQRSNQFNLRTVRYTEEEAAHIARSEEHITLTFTLNDKFGEYGLICVVILKKENNYLFIDSWLMSCRVLKRTMENFTLNTIVAEARKNGIAKIRAEYIPTPKNGMVKDHYEHLGFKNAGGDFWELDVNSFENKTCYINMNQ